MQMCKGVDTVLLINNAISFRVKLHDDGKFRADSSKKEYDSFPKEKGCTKIVSNKTTE